MTRDHTQNLLKAGNPPKELTFDNDIDHFTNHGEKTSKTYKMRYLTNDDHVTGNDAPILFYCGNEGEVHSFYDNSGFITDSLAEAFNAYVVFAEHRYYGESLPFGKESFTPENVRFLTVD